MTAPLYDTGGQAITMWAAETTPNTPVAGTHMLPVMPGQGDATVDWGLFGVEIAAGSVFAVGAQVQSNGKGTWNASYPLYPTLGEDFIANNGLTSGGLVVPVSFSLTLSAKGRAVRYAGCHCTSIKISSGSGNNGVAMVAMSGLVAGGQDTLTPLAVPSVTAEDPFIHRDLQDITLLSGATTVKDVRDVSVDIALNHAADRGNGALLPNIVALDGIIVKGSLMVFFNDTNYAEFAAAQSGTASALSLHWLKAGTGGATKTLAIGHAKYNSGQLKRPKGGLDLLTLPWASFSPTLDPTSISLT